MKTFQCPRQDSNLRSRLRRPLLCTPLTSGNKVPHTMIGGPSGAGGLTAALFLAAQAVPRMMFRHLRACQQGSPAFTGLESSLTCADEYQGRWWAGLRAAVVGALRCGGIRACHGTGGETK